MLASWQDTSWLTNFVLNHKNIFAGYILTHLLLMSAHRCGFNFPLIYYQELMASWSNRQQFVTCPTLRAKQRLGLHLFIWGFNLALLYLGIARGFSKLSLLRLTYQKKKYYMYLMYTTCQVWGLYIRESISAVNTIDISVASESLLLINRFIGLLVPRPTLLAGNGVTSYNLSPWDAEAGGILWNVRLVWAVEWDSLKNIEQTAANEKNSVELCPLRLLCDWVQQKLLLSIG